MRAVLVCLVAALLGAAVIDAATCSTHNFCQNCVDQSGCGYNLFGSGCVSGSYSGPTVTSTSGYVSFVYGNSNGCPSQDPCSYQQDSSNLLCSGCVLSTGCGYDMYSGNCRSGNSFGPTYGAATQWYYGAGSTCSSVWISPGFTAAATAVAIWIIIVPVVLFLCCVGIIIACVVRSRRQTVVVTTAAPVVAAGGAYQPMPAGQAVYA